MRSSLVEVAALPGLGNSFFTRLPRAQVSLRRRKRKSFHTFSSGRFQQERTAAAVRSAAGSEISGRVVKFVAALLIVLASLSGAPLNAQITASARLKGHVVGPGGVAVPGARVILFSPQTRQRKETWTDPTGNYLFTNVSPGSYRLVVVLVGFRPTMAGPVTVRGGGPVEENATLALAMPGQPTGFGLTNRGTRAGGGNRARTSGVGAVAEAASAAANFEAGNVPGMGTEGEANLRFSGEGGGTSGEGANQGSTSSLENSASASNSFVLTGNVVDATAPAQQHGPGAWRFQRFAQEQGVTGLPGFGGGAGPGFGGGGGPGFGRGGGMFFFGGGRRPRVNTIRGNIFETYSNSALDARPFPLNRAAEPQIPYYNNTYGISVGGPLSIPKIYPNGADKTSFFVHYHTILSTSPSDLFDTVPTLAERNGDFSDAVVDGAVPTIYQPSSGPLGPRTPFPGNVIPSSLFNPAATGLLPYIPLPNLPGNVQNLYLQEALPTHNQFIMGRVGQEFSAKDNLAVFYFYNSSVTDGVNDFPDLTSTTSMRNQSVNLTETHTFSPHLINMFSVNFSRARSDLTNPFAFNQNIAGELGITGVSTNPMDWGIPQISLTNFTGLNQSIPSLTRNQTTRFSNYIMFDRGSHNLHVGGDFGKIQLNSLTNPDGEGTFDFTGYGTSDFTAAGTPVSGTGLDFADFLLGLPETTSVRYGTSANYLRSSTYDAYANDDWRILSHLTLDLGGRWEYDAPFTEKYGHLSDIALAPGFSTETVVTGESPGTLPSSLLRGHSDNVAPRFGLAYRPWITHSLVVRAGYGIFYDESIYSQIVNNMIDQPPFAFTSTLVTSPSQILTLQDGFPVKKSTTTNTYAVDPNFLTPYAQTWDAMLEQDLGQNFVLSAAYVGTHGSHLNLLLAPVDAITPTGQVLLPDAQPFIYDTSGAASTYNGFRVSLRHFAHNGLMFFVNYVYSKSIDDAASIGGTSSVSNGGPGGFGGPGGGTGASGLVSSANASVGGTVAQDMFDLPAEWGLSSFNPTQSLNLFTRWELPFGDRKRFLSGGGPLTRIFSNWAISDNTTFSSGTPLTALISGNVSNNVNGSAPFNSLRAEATGEPVLPGGFNRTTLDYFNTAAFTIPPSGVYGNAARNTIPGPPTINFNTSLDRLVWISREKGLNADFRIAASNLFNTVNFSGLSTTVNSSTFGRVTEAGSMRSLTFSLRLRF
jgi:trimeric autotransporter adhesin